MASLNVDTTPSYDISGTFAAEARDKPYDAALAGNTAVHYDSDIPNANQKGKLKNVLNWWDLTCQGIGVIIGTGIFTTPGIVYANQTGASLPIAFLIAFVCMLLVAVMYAEFGAMSPKAGGAYTYTYEAFGQYWAFVMGWDQVLEYAIAFGAGAQSWTSYLLALITLCGGTYDPHYTTSPWNFTENKTTTGNVTEVVTANGYYLNLLAVGFVILVTGVHLWGIKKASMINIPLVALKIVVCILVIAMAATHWNSKHFDDMFPYGGTGFSFFSILVGSGNGLLYGSSQLIYSYLGFTIIAYSAAEAKNPQRDLPRAIVGSLLICTVLYMGIAVTLVGAISYLDAHKYSSVYQITILSTMFDKQFGQKWMAFVVVVGALLGLSSSMMGSGTPGPRLLMSMAEDGLLPSIFGRIHEKWGTPHLSILMMGALAVPLSAVLPFSVLLSMVTLGSLFAFFMVSVGVAVLRYTQPNRHRPYRAPLSDWRFPLLPFLSAALSLVLMLQSDRDNWYRVAGWYFVGFVYYYGWARKNAQKVTAARKRLADLQKATEAAAGLEAGEKQGTVFVYEKDVGGAKSPDTYDDKGSNECVDALPLDNEHQRQVSSGWHKYAVPQYTERV